MHLVLDLKAGWAELCLLPQQIVGRLRAIVSLRAAG